MQLIPKQFMAGEDPEKVVIIATPVVVIKLSDQSLRDDTNNSITNLATCLQSGGVFREKIPIFKTFELKSATSALFIRLGDDIDCI
jgi:hypothetical protein